MEDNEKKITKEKENVGKVDIKTNESQNYSIKNQNDISIFNEYNIHNSAQNLIVHNFANNLDISKINNINNSDGTISMNFNSFLNNNSNTSDRSFNYNINNINYFDLKKDESNEFKKKESIKFYIRKDI